MLYDQIVLKKKKNNLLSWRKQVIHTNGMQWSWKYMFDFVIWGIKMNYQYLKELVFAGNLVGMGL